MKTCCFTGYHPRKLGYDESSIQCDRLKCRFEELVKELIERECVTHFISGLALGVDTYAANIVFDLKKQHSDVTLERAIPCET